jgi:glycerol-3-phosphate acyltransferase PlsY
VNPWLSFSAAALLCYLLGAVPFGYLIGRARGVDIRTVGSGNIGATNVFRAVGRPWGILTFVGDVLKGFIAAFVAPRLAAKMGFAGNAQVLAILCGGAAIAGHNWPVFLGFRGGKGIATSAGVLLGLAWQAMLIALGVWLVVLLLSRYVSLASVFAAAAVPSAAWLLHGRQDRLMPTALTLLGVVAIWRHKSNIRRLIGGTEHRFGGRRGNGNQPSVDK